MTAMKEPPSARQIYGTIGPACADVETLEAMFRAGMTGIRLNLSHVTLAQAADQVDHAPVGISRRITIPQEQPPGTVICQITLQRVGPVDIDKGTAFPDLQRQDADSLGNQLPVQAA